MMPHNGGSTIRPYGWTQREQRGQQRLSRVFAEFNRIHRSRAPTAMASQPNFAKDRSVSSVPSCSIRTIPAEMKSKRPKNGW